MKRVSLLTIFSLCIILLFTSCNHTKEEFKKGYIQIGLIMVDDNMYVYTEKEIPVKIDKSEILGKVTSILDDFGIPTENGQANFNIKGSKYAKYDDNIVVLIDNEWILFLNEKDWTKKIWEKEIKIEYENALEQDIFGDLDNKKINRLLGIIVREIQINIALDYESDIGSIIETSFKDYGINNSKLIDTAKTNIKITISDSK